MSVYRITFTPSAPYFFGNEKTFKYPGQTVENHFGSLYYIKGEKMPSQTALLGALRYILMPQKGFDQLQNEENVKAIGSASFDIDHEDTPQTFGKIQKLSSVFIRKGEEYFIPTPFDHNTASEPDSKEKMPISYSPLSGYMVLYTADGRKLYLNDYDTKKGIADSFMSITDNHLEKNLFKSDLRVGVNRSEQNDGFFKKEYISLASGYAFAIFAMIEDDSLDGEKYAVLMGQGKVPFAVSFEKQDDDAMDTFYGRIAEALEKNAGKYDKIYCLGDMLVNDCKLYDGMLLAITKTRDFRSFKTKADGKIEKGSKLHRLISAGSVFVPAMDGKILEKDFKTWAEVSEKQKNAATIGFNQVIFVKKSPKGEENK